MQEVYWFMWWNMHLVSFQSWELILQYVSSGLMKLDETIGYYGRYGCNNGRYGCVIVMSYTEINKAVSQWLLTFNLCVSVTWPLTCAFHIPCTHTLKSLICTGACVINRLLTHLRACRLHYCDQPSAEIRGTVLPVTPATGDDDAHCVTMMTSSNGNIFRVTGLLCGELIPASDEQLWYFLWSPPEPTVEQTMDTPVIWDAIALIMMSL